MFRGLIPNCLLFFSIVMTIPGLSFGEVRIRGSVRDATTEEVLPGASVSVPVLGTGTSTGVDGLFVLRLPEEANYVIHCRLVGYADTTATVHVRIGTEISFLLRPVPIELGSVEVVDERYLHKETPQSVNILTEEDLHRSQGQTLGESLEQIPGVTVLTTGPSISKPVIRGLHSQRILVLNAGVPQEGQQWGGEHAPEIDPFAPGRIEVLKGVSGVRYGSGAIGGVIRVMPRVLPERPDLAGQLTLNGFSNNRQISGSGSMEGGIVSLPGFGWRLQGSLRKAGNATTSDYFLRNTGFEELNGSVAVGYMKEQETVEVYASHFGTTLGILSDSHIGNLDDLERAIERGRPATDGSFTYDVVPPSQEISHDLVSVHGSTDILPGGKLDLQVGWQENSRTEFDAHGASEGSPSFNLTLTTWSVDAEYRHNPLGNFFGSFGVSGLQQSNIQQGDVFLIPNFQAYSAGVFIMEKWAPGRLTVETGVRYDYKWFETFIRTTAGGEVETRVHQYTNLSAAVGGMYTLVDTWSAGIQVGSAWRPPSLNELYSNDVHHGTAQFEIGDLNLGEERSVSLDLTIKHDGERTSAELSAYVTHFNGFIQLFPLPDPTVTIRGAFPTFEYRQTRARLTGFDGFVEYQLAPFVRLGGSIAVVRGEDLDQDQPLFGIPANRYGLTAHFHLPPLNAFDDAYVEVGGTFVEEQGRAPEGVDYAEPPPGYFLLGVNMGVSLLIVGHPLQINLSVRNVLNTLDRDYLSRYRYFADDPGRDVVVRLNIPFGAYQ